MTEEEPTTDFVRGIYAHAGRRTVRYAPVEVMRERQAEFDRWLRAELARAWDEGAEACAAAPLLQEFGPNPYRKATDDE